MHLMSRIKVKNFLSFTPLEKIQWIEKIQALRINALEEARTKNARGLTKSAKKNLKKRKKYIDPKKAAKTALKKLTQVELNHLKEMYS